MNSFYRFVIKKPYMDLLLSLYESEHTVRQASKQIGIGYGHLTGVVRALDQDGIVRRVMRNSVYDIELTEKGKKVVRALWEVRQAIQEMDD